MIESPAQGYVSDVEVESDPEEVASEETPDLPSPVPTPLQPRLPGPRVRGPGIRPRWVPRPVHVVRDFPRGCGPHASSSRPPLPSAPVPAPVRAPSPRPGTVSPIPYHVDQALSRDFLRVESPELAAHFDHVLVAPFQGVSAPSPEIRQRVRQLTEVAIERARGITPFVSPEDRSLQYRYLVDWLVYELGVIGGSG